MGQERATAHHTHISFVPPTDITTHTLHQLIIIIIIIINNSKPRATA